MYPFGVLFQTTRVAHPRDINGNPQYECSCAAAMPATPQMRLSRRPTLIGGTSSLLKQPLAEMEKASCWQPRRTHGSLTFCATGSFCPTRPTAAFAKTARSGPCGRQLPLWSAPVQSAAPILAKRGGSDAAHSRGAGGGGG